MCEHLGNRLQQAAFTYLGGRVKAEGVIPGDRLVVLVQRSKAMREPYVVAEYHPRYSTFDQLRQFRDGNEALLELAHRIGFLS